MIAENLKQLREKIAKKCTEAGRNPSEIKLVAVSKTFRPEEILAAFNQGVHDFGENKAQELDAKFEVIGNKVTWHFIGHLQRNKVKFVVKSAEYIHSVDSLLLAQEINKRAEKINKVQKILLQIKTSQEETKSGIENESEVRDLIGYCSQMPNLELTGLMTISPLTDDKNLIRQSFLYLRKLRDELNSEGFNNIKELSMGMTSDYEIAIEEGATILRIGSAIFGQRDYSKEGRG
jgi:pyridoxal phosphate enzyme (YggS family)